MQTRNITGHSLDGLVERLTRQLAQRSSRRSVLTFMGRVVFGGFAFPLLPIDRTANKSFAESAQTKDPTKCNYWRYCAADGYMCSCCGGSPSSCPPGTSLAPSSWVGTCLNPDDGQTYLISYQDCCGKDSCGRCACGNTEEELPVYEPQFNSDIVWCFGAPNMVYHCSTAHILSRVKR